VLAYHSALPMRAALVAGAGAVLGLLALANVSSHTPPQNASVEKAALVSARIAAPVVLDPVALARADSLTR
jgi:hypothetical protein